MIRILLSTKLGELRWTQADLARATGIRPNTINELYHELVDRVNLEHLDLICEALDCKLDELIIRVPDARPKVIHTKNGSLISSSDRQCCNTAVEKKDVHKANVFFISYFISAFNSIFFPEISQSIPCQKSCPNIPGGQCVCIVLMAGREVAVYP